MAVLQPLPAWSLTQLRTPSEPGIEAPTLFDPPPFLRALSEGPLRKGLFRGIRELIITKKGVDTHGTN